MKQLNLGNLGSLANYAKRHSRRLMPFLTVRKSINIIHALASMYTKRTVLSSRPFVVKIEISQVCNLRCPPCTAWKLQKTLPPDQRYMSLETFRHVLHQISPYCLRASLYSNGEPLMNPHFYEMVRLAHEAGMSTGISTNFNLFEPSDLERLFQSHLTHLEICLDGFSQQAYEHYRVGGDVEKVKRNIELVTRYKREHRCRYPEIDVQVVKFGHIRHEIPAITEFCLKHGVDSLTFREEGYGFEKDLYPSEKALGSNPARRSLANKHCFWPWIGMLILLDGRVAPCCIKRPVFGDIVHQSLSEIWNSTIYVESRKQIVNSSYVPKVPTVCTGCVFA